MDVWEKGGRERERKTAGYGPFAVHALLQWAIQGDVIRSRGRAYGHC